MRPNFSYRVSVVYKDFWDSEAYVFKEFYVMDFHFTPVSLLIYGPTKITEISLYDLKEFHVQVILNHCDQRPFYDPDPLPFPEVEDEADI